jgi:spore germination protein
MAERLHSLGYYFITTVAPKEAAGQRGLLYEAHDYAAHGRYADRVVIMTYEWGYTYSPPQAVSPVNRMRGILDYAVTVIPSGKILLGFSNYGYSYALPWRQGDAARVISNSAAADLASSVYAEIRFDPLAQASHFTYTDAAGARREVWFEDPRSWQARLGLVEEYDLAGISMWTINRLYRPGLAVIDGMYGVEKIV